jgi:CDP-diglyceride synthetase
MIFTHGRIFFLVLLLVALGLFAGMVVALEIGRRIGIRRVRKDPEAAREGFGASEGAIFALLGLLIAFTFSGAAERFDGRRRLIIEETNAIGTAYLRVDLVAPDLQPALRDEFRRYLAARLDVYRKAPDMAAVDAALAEADRLQRNIWERAIAATRAPGSHPQAAVLLLPALNAMIDITTTRTMATHFHPPVIIYILLILLALVSALLAGEAMATAKTRSWVHVVAFAAAMAISLYVILEIEYPRLGLIRVDSFDQTLLDLHQLMK